MRILSWVSSGNFLVSAVVWLVRSASSADNYSGVVDSIGPSHVMVLVHIPRVWVPATWPFMKALLWGPLHPAAALALPALPVSAVRHKGISANKKRPVGSQVYLS
jgi:hypothetical protein